MARRVEGKTKKKEHQPGMLVLVSIPGSPDAYRKENLELSQILKLKAAGRTIIAATSWCEV